MKIGIIVHSQSGFTLRFGKRIAEKLREAGHTIEVLELKTSGPVQPGAKDVAITNMPDCRPFDALLVGGPVLGFAASPAVLACIKGLQDVKGKKALPFVTMGFPFPGMGGKQATAQMGHALEAAGASVLPPCIIPKMFHDKVQLMERAACAIPALFA